MSPFSFYNCTHLNSVIELLESQTAQEQPSFVRKVVLGYLQKKLDKGMSSSQVGEKLHALESAMYRRQVALPTFPKQVAEIRSQLFLPPSKVFPRSTSRRVVPPPNLQPAPPYSPTNSSSSSSSPASSPTPTIHPYLYLPICPFKDEDLPPYTSFSSNPILARRSRAREISNYFQQDRGHECFI